MHQTNSSTQRISCPGLPAYLFLPAVSPAFPGNMKSLSRDIRFFFDTRFEYSPILTPHESRITPHESRIPNLTSHIRSSFEFFSNRIPFPPHHAPAFRPANYKYRVTNTGFRTPNTTFPSIRFSKRISFFTSIFPIFPEHLAVRPSRTPAYCAFAYSFLYSFLLLPRFIFSLQGGIVPPLSSASICPSRPPCVRHWYTAAWLPPDTFQPTPPPTTTCSSRLPVHCSSHLPVHCSSHLPVHCSSHLPVHCSSRRPRRRGFLRILFNHPYLPNHVCHPNHRITIPNYELRIPLHLILFPLRVL